MKLVSIIILLLALVSANSPAQTPNNATLDRVILPEVTFNGLELSKVAYVLSLFSRIYGDGKREVTIRVQASGEGNLFNIPVTYKAKNIDRIDLLYGQSFFIAQFRSSYELSYSPCAFEVSYEIRH